MNSFTDISFEVVDRIAQIGLGISKETHSFCVLNKKVMDELDQAITLVESLVAKDQSVDGLILFSHQKNFFSSGIDLDVLNHFKTPYDAAQFAAMGQNVCNRISDLSIPTAACIDGYCLGAGFDLALSCDSIFSTSDEHSIFGHPEVNLGIIPVFGGIYRLPLKLSLELSLKYLLTGQTMTAKQAFDCLLVQKILPRVFLLSQTREFLLDSDLDSRRSTHRKNLKSFLGKDNFLRKKMMFQSARETVLEKTKGLYRAPIKVLDLIESQYGHERERCLAEQAQAFGDLVFTEQSQYLRHLHILTQKAKKAYRCSVLRPEHHVFRVALLGTRDQVKDLLFELVKYDVKSLLVGKSWEQLENLLEEINGRVNTFFKNRSQDPKELEFKQRLIMPSLDKTGAAVTDFFIEEFNDEKQLGDLKVWRKNTLLAHIDFLRPLYRNPLIEIRVNKNILEGDQKEDLAYLHNFFLHLKKIPIVTVGGDKGILKRFLGRFFMEALFLLHEGISPTTLDQLCWRLGMNRGPCELIDFLGRDNVLDLLPECTEEELKFIREIFDLGPFYEVDEGVGKKDIATLVKQYFAKEAPSVELSLLQQRLFLPLINEAAAILDENISNGPGDLDLILIHALGLPAFRGGPLYFASKQGMGRIVKAISNLSYLDVSKTYVPHPYLEKLVREGKSFYDL